MKIAKIFAGLAALGLALAFVGCPVSVDGSSKEPAEKVLPLVMIVPTWNTDDTPAYWDYDNMATVDGRPGINLNDPGAILDPDDGSLKIGSGTNGVHNSSNPNPGIPRIIQMPDGRATSSGIFGVPGHANKPGQQ